MKKIILIAIALIAILSISGVQAADNMTEAMSDSPQEIISDNASQKEDLNVEIYAPNYIVMPDPNDGFRSIELKNLPDDYHSQISVYIDDEFITQNSDNYFYDSVNLRGYDYGKHHILVVLPETEKYNPLNVTHDFEVTTGYIEIDERVKTTEGVHLKLREGATGYLTVNVDGKLFKKVKVTAQEYDTSHAFVSLGTLSKGTHSVEAIYSGDTKNNKITKKATVKVSKEVSIEIELPLHGYTNGVADNSYGSVMNKVTIYLSSDATKTPSVSIDGVAYGVKRNDEIFQVDTSTLKPGMHVINVTYPGDSKYPKRSVSQSFETICDVRIYSPNDLSYRYDNTEISLKMPGDAKGDLNVYIDGTEYERCPVEKGTALIHLKGVKIGTHHVEAYYTGDDYKVSNISDNITILPNLIYPLKKIVNEKASFHVKVNPDANLTVTVAYDTHPFNLTLTDGEGDFSITHLKVSSEWGDFYDIELRYSGDINLEETAPVFIYMISYQFANEKDITMYYGDSKTYTMTLLDHEYKKVKDGATVKVKIGSRYFYPKVKNGVVKVKINEVPGTYKVVASYKDAKSTTKLTVKHILSLKAVTVKKSAGKLILTATLKNKSPIKGKAVTFKFAGKTYKAKTNNKGIAKVTVPKSVLSKLKVGKTITYQATYLKDTVKRTAKVKK